MTGESTADSEEGLGVNMGSPVSSGSVLIKDGS
jgi:hypothetical protein